LVIWIRNAEHVQGKRGRKEGKVVCTEVRVRIGYKKSMGFDLTVT
jgi:hypothetical protein